MLRIEIDTSNAAFFHVNGDPDGGTELARIVKAASDRINTGATDGNLKDINGNTVGNFRTLRDDIL